MAIDRERILSALRGVPFPGFSRDLVHAGVISTVSIDEGDVSIDLATGNADPNTVAKIEAAVRAAVEPLAGVQSLKLQVLGQAAGSDRLPVAGASPKRPSVAASGAVDTNLIPEVQHTIAVASGKGGVGKSTVAVNLALALARNGARVGLLDADIYGPSIPMMTGLAGEPGRRHPREHKPIVPFERFGVRLISLGFFLDSDTAAIWRGPMVMKAIQQLLGDVDWGPLDILVVDMPPGTGDAQLTLSQRVRLAGAVVVSTPQDFDLADAIRVIAMFRKVSVPVLGLIENMSYFHCPHCSERSDVFGHGGGSEQAERLGVPFLGEIPLDAGVRRAGDDGTPTVAADPDSPISRSFLEIAKRVQSSLGDEKADEPERSGQSWFDRIRSRNK